MRARVRTSLRVLAGAGVTAGSLWFMASQASISFARVSEEMGRAPLWAMGAAILLFGCSLVAENVIWHRLLGTLPGQAQALSFADAFVVLNVTAVGKYLPGKVWGYAWQAFLFDQRGVSPRASLWTHAVVTVAALASGAVLGGATAAAGRLGMAVVLVSVAAGLVFLGLVPLHERLALVERVESRLGINLSYAKCDLRQWSRTVLGYCGVWALYGGGGILLAAVIGPGLGFPEAARVFASLCLSWIVGTAAVVAPAGLGVREAAMALALGKAPGSLALALPILIRLLLMIAEFALQAIALVLLWCRRPGSLPHGGRDLDQTGSG